MLVDLITTLFSQTTQLFEKARVPDFIQYHVGPIEYEKIEEWANKQEEIDQYSTKEMLNIPGANIYLVNNEEKALKSDVMEYMFVTQNEDFDFLLGMDDKPIEVDKGEIGVPLYK